MQVERYRLIVQPSRAGGMDMRRVRLSWVRRSSPSRGCPRPDAGPGRAHGRPLAVPSAFALLAGALCLFPPAPAAAQDTILVSNIGQTRFTSPISTNGFVISQGFTTGDAASGYTLSSIEMVLGAASPADSISTIRAVLWAAKSDATQGTVPDTTIVANLTVPSSVPAGTVAFAAPAATTLSANTTYYASVYTTGTVNLQLGRTEREDEDSSSQPGWSIGDGLRFQRTNEPGPTWSSHSHMLRIRVNGVVPVTEPPGPPVGLGVTPGAAKLDLEWTAPAGAASYATSYDVHYTSSTTVAAGAAVQTGASPSPSAGWVDASHTGTTASHSITGLTNDTAYRVRVRGVNSLGDGAWAWGTGTPKASTSGSTDATLSALSLSSVTLDPAFSSTTYAYAAEVTATVTGVTVTPAVNQSNATVKVNGTTVASGVASGSIDLDYGSNTIMVEVTAQAGNSRHYAVTVTRALPVVAWPNATETRTEGSALELGFTVHSNDMVGTVTYAEGIRRTASLADDLGSGRSTGFTMSLGDTSPSTIEVPIVDDALNEENETFTITIGEGTGYTVGSPATVTVTITDNDPPAAPGGLAVAAPALGHDQLTATWTKPDGPVTGYQARWKETAAPDSTVTDGSGDPSLGWVEGGQLSSSPFSETITDLTGGTGYDVQVRATDGQTAAGNGYGPWTATQTGTPREPAGPAEVRFLSVVERYTSLSLRWTAPADPGTSAVTGYDVHYTSAPSTGNGAVLDDASASGTDASAAWVAVTRSGTARSQSITGLTTDTPYRVRVRAVNAAGASPWVHHAATPGLSARVSLSVEPDSVIEGYRVTVRATLSKARSSTVRIPIAVWQGSAESSDFYFPGGQAIRISGGQTTGSITIITRRDPDTDDETFTVRLGTLPVNVSSGSPSSVTVTIVEDTRPAVSLSATPNPVNEGDAVTVRATLSAALADTISIPIYTNPDVFRPPEDGDYGPVPSHILIRSGQTYGEVEIPTNRDADNENEGFIVAVAGLPSTFRVANGSPSELYIAIRDITVATAVRLALDPAAVWEHAGQTDVEVTVSLNGTAHSQDIEVSVAQTGGDAVSGTDYAAITPLTVTIPAGSTSATGTLSFTPTDDSAEEESETVVLTATASGLTSGRAALTILDNDGQGPEVSLSAGPEDVYEGDPVTVGVWLSERLPLEVSIPVVVEVDPDTGDPREAERSDIGPDTTVVIPAGGTYAEVTIATTADTDQDDELFLLKLGTLPAGLVQHRERYQKRIRIVDAERVPPVEVSMSVKSAKDDSFSQHARVTEGDSVTVRVTLSKALSFDLPVQLENRFHNFFSPSQIDRFRRIVIPAGRTFVDYTLATYHDPDIRDEALEIFVFRSTLPIGVDVGASNEYTVRITFVDDDEPRVTLEVSPNPVLEGSEVTVTARMAAVLPYDVTIPLTLTAGSAETGDYDETVTSVTIPTCPTSVYVTVGCTVSRRGPGTVTIKTNRDGDLEDETFTVSVGSPLPPEVPTDNPSSVEVTIEELRATVEASTLRPAEGRTATLTATLNHPAPAGGGRLAFTANSADDNPAYPLTDFTLEPAGEGQTQTAWFEIAEGQRTARATLRVVDDNEPEDDEGIAVGIATSLIVAEYPELELTIPANDGAGGASAVAWIEVEPNPVPEGSDVTVLVRLSRALEADTRIPLSVRRGTSAADDHGTLDEVVILAGEDIGAGTITTTRDEDADEETFTVRLGTLPRGVRAGSPSSVEIVIEDADAPDVWLEVESNAVPEGDPVTVTAMLTEALDRIVTIPVEVEDGTSESGDHGSLPSIRIASGETEGTGRITTARDADGEDETFTVSLGADLPPGVNAGHPTSVEVVIVDEGVPAAAEVSLHAEPDPVPEGDPVTVTATLTEALDRGVSIPVEVEGGTSESGDHGSLSSIRIASGETSGTGRVTTRVDDDTEDETFTVRLRDNLPAGVAEGGVPSIEVTIADRGGDVPGRPRSLRVTTGYGRLDLAWTAPSSGTVTAYEAWYKQRSESEWSVAYEDDYQDTSAEIAGLENGTRYDVRVRGTNDHAEGPWATGSGTPRAAAGTSGQLRSLTVTAGATRDGTYAAATLSPSFRPSVTEYTATAAAGTNFVKVTPTSADGREVLVEGTLVESGAESGPVQTGNDQVIMISAFQGDGTPNHYLVTMSVTSAASAPPAGVEAALAVVGPLGPEDAAGALLGGSRLEEARLDALDRLGNANGRYDLGDLLAWIERCREGGARCGMPLRTPPPASAAALPGAAGAVAAGVVARRPRRRTSRGRVPGRRRLHRLTVLLAAALWSCDGAGVVGLPEAADLPEPGTLAVEWTAPAGGPVAAGALVEIDGPHVGDAHAPGLDLYAADEGRGPRRFVVAGDMRNGPVLEFRVPDRRLAGLYSVRVVEVAGEDHRLLEPGHYRATVTN